MEKPRAITAIQAQKESFRIDMRKSASIYESIPFMWSYNALRADVAHRKRRFVTFPRSRQPVQVTPPKKLLERIGQTSHRLGLAGLTRQQTSDRLQ
jgi:hypothetical protein